MKEVRLRADDSDAQALRDASFEVQRSAMVFVDVTDLLLYLRDHTTLSGIQRVQCEIVRNLIELDGAANVRFVALDCLCNPHAVETTTLLNLMTYMGSTPVIRAELDPRLDSTFSHAGAPNIRQGDTFISIGAFWGIRGDGIFLQTLKNLGVKIGFYIHDILNITHSEYFNVSETNKYVKGFVEATTFADFFLTTSQYNKASLVRHLEARQTNLPVEVVPLGHELWVSQTAGKVSSAVADIGNSEFVLGVGTIEVRKNPTYLFNIWKMMIQDGRKNIPKLVLAGRRGWLVRDFMEQLNACDHLGGRIVLLHDATDVELALLYRKCILTMFPSFAEGWGLPVGESIARGKICIASKAGGIPEVAGALADYVDPYNASDGLRVLSQYLDDPDLRRRRESEIADNFKPRPWQNVAEAFLKSVQTQAGQIKPFEGVAAIKLPPNRFLPITSDGSTLLVNPIEGDLSADLICISGWRLPEMGAVRADRPKAVIRFRVEAPAGTGISLLMRLRGTYAGARRVRIRSGSGAEAEVSLNELADSLAVLSCEVELDNLVSAVLSLDGSQSGSDEGAAGYWALKGILYIPSERQVSATEKGRGSGRAPFQADGSAPRTSVDRQNSSRRPDSRKRIEALAVEIDNTRRAASLDAFLSSADSYWPSSLISHRDAPIFADHTDKRIFYESRDGVVGSIAERITFVRRSHQYVSTSRFSEGTVFDSSGASRGFGYLNDSPAHAWLLRNDRGIWISEAAIADAPYYDKSYLIFYNGNLHNYYHWVVEGLLPLYVLSQTIGQDPNLNIVLPRSRYINAVFDHRESLRAVGLDGYDITEVAENFIKVREAVWAERDIVQTMPAPYLKDFQRKVVALHSGSRLSKKRRLLVARKGPTRMIHNLRHVRSFLSRRGFETVYLEGMSVIDQIVLFQNAEFIISPHGAGLANLLFCEPGTKVIEFMPSAEMRPFFWLISEKLDLVHGMLFCASANGKGFQDSVDVDVDKLEALYHMVDAHC